MMLSTPVHELSKEVFSAFPQVDIEEAIQLALEKSDSTAIITSDTYFQLPRESEQIKNLFGQFGMKNPETPSDIQYVVHDGVMVALPIEGIPEFFREATPVAPLAVMSEHRFMAVALQTKFPQVRLLITSVDLTDPQELVSVSLLIDGIETGK